MNFLYFLGGGSVRIAQYGANGGERVNISKNERGVVDPNCPKTGSVDTHMTNKCICGTNFFFVLVLILQ